MTCILFISSCVRAREREREREREGESERERERETKTEKENDREREFVCVVCLFVCVGGGMNWSLTGLIYRVL